MVLDPLRIKKGRGMIRPACNYGALIHFQGGAKRNGTYLVHKTFIKFCPKML